MSANYTQHYSLCQWEPDDKVLREEFNADNAKLEAALTALREEIAAVRTLAETAYTTSLPQVVAGTYTGNGRPVQDISLGFHPKAVFVLDHLPIFNQFPSYTTYFRGGLATRQAVSGSDASRWEHGYTALMVTPDGFRVAYNEDRNTYSPFTNANGEIYSYIAIR